MEFNDWKQFCADIQARVKDGHRAQCWITGSGRNVERNNTLHIFVKGENEQRFDYGLTGFITRGLLERVMTHFTTQDIENKPFLK